MGPGSLDSELLLTTRAGTRASAQGTQAAKLRETSLSGLCGCRVSAGELGLPKFCTLGALFASP